MLHALPASSMWWNPRGDGGHDPQPWIPRELSQQQRLHLEDLPASGLWWASRRASHSCTDSLHLWALIMQRLGVPKWHGSSNCNRWQVKPFLFFVSSQEPTFSSSTSPRRPTTTSWRYATGPLTPARWLADSAARTPRPPSSPPPTRPPCISTAIIRRTNRGSDLSTRVRDRRRCAKGKCT